MPHRVRIAVGTLMASLALTAPSAVAGVAGVGVTDGSGGEQAVSPALKVRMLQPTMRLRLQPNATQSYTVSVVGPDGGVAGTGACGQLPDGLVLGYRGNGSYTVLVTSYVSASCADQIGPVQTFTYTQASAVTVTAPTTPVLSRAAGATKADPIVLPLTAPSDGTTEVRFANGGNIDPTGAIIGGGAAGSVAGDRRSVSVVPSAPGSYVVVARQAAGGFATAWSAPAVVKVVAPFDLKSVRYPDTGGPVFEVRGVVRERAAAGAVVTVAVARGSKGGAFRGAKSVTVRGDGSFTARFKASSGTGRIRFSFAGNPLVVKGEQLRAFRVRAGRLTPQ